MDYLFRHWRGEVSINKAVWLSGFIAWAVVAPLGYLEFQAFLAANNVADISELIENAINSGGELSLIDPPLPLAALDQLLDTNTFIWWAVGTWRACNNPKNQAIPPKKYWFLKATILCGAIGSMYDFIEFIMKL